VFTVTETPSVFETLILPVDKRAAIWSLEKLRLRDEAGASSIRPNLPKLIVAELVSVVTIVPSDMKVRPLNARSPLTTTKAFSPLSRGPLTVISAEAVLLAGEAMATIVWTHRSEIERDMTVKRENTRDNFELFMK
jgi:hypothetical protein